MTIRLTTTDVQNITIATEFFAYLPEGDPNPVEVTRLSKIFANLGYITYQEPTLIGWMPVDAISSTVSLSSVILHVPAGTAVAIAARISHIAEAQHPHSFASNELRLYNLISCEQDSIAIHSDPLGVLPYYWAHVSNGLILCSSIRHIFVALPSLSREVDELGVFEFLCCGTPFTNRTLHRHIRLSSAGQTVHWERGESTCFDRTGRVKVAVPDPAVGTATAADQVAVEICESLRKLPTDAVLPLTGGFDSRLIAAFATSLQLNPRMVSMGYRSHDEIRVARAVGKILGTKTSVFSPPYPNALDLLPLWLECSAGLADVQALFLANLIYLPEADGTPVYHGFIGDTLSGARLNAIGLEQAVTREEIANGVATKFFADISSCAGEALHISASLDNVKQDILSELIPGVATHQAFTVWNLETIQRRFVGQQFLFVGKRFRSCPVFYYPPLMQVWLSQPRMALDFRMLLRDIFVRYFPKLASLPHAEHVPHDIPRTTASLQYLAGWIMRQGGLKILRKLRVGADQMEKHSYIWSLWHGIGPEEKKRELLRIEETHSLLKSRLGWNAPQPNESLWIKCATTKHRQLLLLRRMHLLGEYAQSLPDVDSNSNGQNCIVQHNCRASRTV